MRGEVDETSSLDFFATAEPSGWFLAMAILYVLLVIEDEAEIFRVVGGQRKLRGCSLSSAATPVSVHAITHQLCYSPRARLRLLSCFL